MKLATGAARTGREEAAVGPEIVAPIAFPAVLRRVGEDDGPGTRMPHGLVTRDLRTG